MASKPKHIAEEWMRHFSQVYGEQNQTVQRLSQQQLCPDTMRLYDP